jgi:hypothetical protein
MLPQVLGQLISEGALQGDVNVSGSIVDTVTNRHMSRNLCGKVAHAVRTIRLCCECKRSAMSEGWYLRHTKRNGGGELLCALSETTCSGGRRTPTIRKWMWRWERCLIRRVPMQRTTPPPHAYSKSLHICGPIPLSPMGLVYFDALPHLHSANSYGEEVPRPVARLRRTSLMLARASRGGDGAPQRAPPKPALLPAPIGQ